MHLLIANPPILFITIIIITTSPISSTSPLSPSADDPIFSSQDSMFPNDTPTLSLDSTTLGSSMAISDAEGDEEAPFMSYFPNGDALGADPEPDTDLLSLGTDCKLSANAQAEIATTDLSSSFLWTRDETTMCPDPSREDQKLDIPALTDLFQDLGTWLPKKPPPANLELTEGIRLPAPLELSGSGGEECFVSFPNHCCCEGERGVSGRMMGGLIRVAIIKECELVLLGGSCLKRDDVCCRLLSGTTGIDCIGQQ